MTNCADHGQQTETKFAEPYLKVFWLSKDDVKRKRKNVDQRGIMYFLLNTYILWKYEIYIINEQNKLELK